MKMIGKLVAVATLGLVSTLSYATELVVGGKGFTEQLLLASMTEQYLAGLGYDVDKRDGMGSTVLRKAQLNGQIDLYWEYTGTSLITYNKIKEKLDGEATYAKVKELDAKQGLVWLTPSKANNTYALAMRADDAQAKGLKTISDLAAFVKGDGKDTLFASNAEFAGRADGLRPMQKAYGFKFARPNVKKMNSGLTYTALKAEEVEVALVFATDGRNKAFNFTLLEDDKGFFPNYAIVPVVREDTLKANPQLAEQMNALSAKLDDDVVSNLNATVDVEGKSIEAAAKAFLVDNGLLK